MASSYVTYRLPVKLWSDPWLGWMDLSDFTASLILKAKQQVHPQDYWFHHFRRELDILDHVVSGSMKVSRELGGSTVIGDTPIYISGIPGEIMGNDGYALGHSDVVCGFQFLSACRHLPWLSAYPHLPWKDAESLKPRYRTRQDPR